MDARTTIELHTKMVNFTVFELYLNDRKLSPVDQDLVNVKRKNSRINSEGNEATARLLKAEVHSQESRQARKGAALLYLWGFSH